MKRMNIFALAALILGMAMLGGCAKESKPADMPENTAAPKQYALVVKDVSNPYMQYICEGFENACAEIGVNAILAGPDSITNEGQIRQVEALIEAGVDAITIAVNDMDALSEVLGRAMDAGIPVISVDSSTRAADRMLHIQQASPEIIGRVLVQAAYEMIGGEGSAAILSTTEVMPNQALWVDWMNMELSEHSDKYAGFELCTVVYGNDEYESSAECTRELIEQYPDLDIIIAPTSVGIKAAADVISECGAKTKVTGLGLPGDMAPYIRSGICPWMYLWNPIDLGYISAYAADALVNGTATGSAGETISTGSFGQKLVEISADGGTEVVVGNPYQFDSSNIAIWEEMF